MDKWAVELTSGEWVQIHRACNHAASRNWKIADEIRDNQIQKDFYIREGNNFSQIAHKVMNENIESRLTFRKLMDLYSDWNCKLAINNKSMERVYEGLAWKLVENHPELQNEVVMAFSCFTDDDSVLMCVRLEI